MTDNIKKCEVWGLIKPQQDFIRFSQEAEKLNFLKKVKLIAPTAEEIKPFFYNGLYSNGYCRCEIIGYESDSTLIIELDNHLHCINTECFSDMQPLVKEIEAYKHIFPVYVNKN